MDDHLYTVQIRTGDSVFAGTDANVFVTLYGENGASREVFLEKSLDHTNLFERGNTDTFKIAERNLGRIFKLKIRHDNKGPGASWLLNSVEVRDDETGQKFTFSCYDWLFKDQQEKTMYHELNTDREQSYKIQVHTGDSLFAGTDSNVFITLYGQKGTSHDIFLEKSLNHKDPFERGHIDTFHVKARELGVIHKVKIRHDDTGTSSSWQLNRVIVTDNETGRKFDFPCRKWIFKICDEVKLEHELESESIPIIGVDPLKNENSEGHHTKKFKTEKPALVVRRGQTFKLLIKFSRDYEEKDSFYLTLKTGARPRDKDKTLTTVPEISQRDFRDWKSNEKWGYTIYDKKDPKNLIIEVYSPPNALPAKYSLEIDTDIETVCTADFPIYLLFNPWCRGDEVFMDDEGMLREYILRQYGQLYVGSWHNPHPRRWHFGQFEEISLDTAFTLLGRRKAQGRDTAVEVSRVISSLVNSNDNNGIVVGNWSGEYDGGKSPSYWTSTPAILEKFMVDQQPVKYGQCWVFSAVFTTIMRTLGIPCRSVSNFSSAHDSDGNCTNDLYFNRKGDPYPNKSHDSVWNFHVWNDVWMRRSDLPPGYGGWQAADATPQERSQGLFQLGPTPLRAVKEGQIDFKYDTAFVLAEVNADTVHWLENGSGAFEAVKRDRTSIGKRLSTKAVNSNEREDLTDLYKFPEGSVLERTTVRNALTRVGNSVVRVTRKDLSMKLLTYKDQHQVGDDVALTIALANTGREDLSAFVAVNGQIVRYDGMEIGKLEKYTESISVKANTTESIPIRVEAASYLSYVQDDNMLRFVAFAEVPSTGQVELTNEVINFLKPELELINMPKRFKVGKEETFTVSFTNPIPKPLTQCEIYVDGSIIKNRLYIGEISEIPAETTFKMDIKLKADAVDKISKKSIIVSFCSKEMGGIRGSTKVYVEN